MSKDSSWLPIITGFGGVVLGFVLLLLKDWWTRRRKHKAYWHALKAELEFARGLADTFLSDRVAAPLYRLPRDAFDSCYPELLADGAVSEAESHALMAYFNEVATMNRGLDRAADASDDATLKAEYERNRLKAERLARGPLYDDTAAALARHVR